MIKLISIILLISFLFLSCNNKELKQNLLLNINDTSLLYLSNFKIDSAAIHIFLDKKNISDSVKIQVNQFYLNRNYTSAWLNDSGSKEAVFVFYNQLKNHCYNFADTTLNNIRLEHLINALNADKVKFFSQKNNSKQLELELTTTFFKFARVAYSGSAKNLQNLEWFIPRQYKNYQLLLDSLITITKGKTTNEPLNEYYFRLKNKLIHYRNIDKKGGLPLIVFNKTLSIGSIDTTIITIKQYLFLISDLKINDKSNVFTDSLQHAVKLFQHRMGLIETGTIDSTTILELNKPLAFRVKQIMINMERLRWLPVTIEKNYILINIPEYKLHVFKNGKPVWATNIVVGKSATQTTIFKSNIFQIILNPYWGVPQSIANKEILPHLKNNPNYLKNNNMEVLSGNNVVNPNAINWYNYETRVPFTFRQKPGKNNALGKIKFLFPNNYDIYLHDTPSKNKFENNQRAFSHGCIRVSEPKKLATYLLVDNTYWNTQKINNTLKTDKEVTIQLATSVPIYIVYFTCWVDNTGQLNFRNDLYDLDKKLATEIFDEH